MVVDWVSVSLKDILKKLDDFLRELRREIKDCPDLPQTPSKVERLWRAQRRRADRERWRVRLKYLEFLYTIKRCKPYQKARSDIMMLKQLEQYRDLAKEVKMLERKISDLESRPGSFVADSVVGSSPCIPFQPHAITIQGYGNQYQDKINVLRAKYAARKKALVGQLEEIETFVDGLEDSRLRQLIEYRYIKGMPWNAVAKNVYGYPNGDTARMTVTRFFSKK